MTIDTFNYWIYFIKFMCIAWDAIDSAVTLDIFQFDIYLKCISLMAAV